MGIEGISVKGLTLRSSFWGVDIPLGLNMSTVLQISARVSDRRGWNDELRG
jgi:hypothetical protein